MAARRPRLVQSATASLAAALAAVGVLRLEVVTRNDAFSWQHERWAYVIPAAVAVGGLLYTLGTAVGGSAGLALRRAGWAAMVVALLLPSTASLALPLLALLVVTLVRPAAGPARSASSSSP